MMLSKRIVRIISNLETSLSKWPGGLWTVIDTKFAAKGLRDAIGSVIGF
jgi:hypothetical protein